PAWVFSNESAATCLLPTRAANRTRAMCRLYRMPNRIRFRRPSRWLAERRDAIDEYSLAVSRPLASVWPLIQAAMAGTLAWVIARHLVGNHEPFFAPIAAVVALNQPLGERGSNGIRILLGVVLGIVVGEIVVSILGSGYVSVGVA